jgi:protease-4
MMQAYVNRGYELFVKRCADGRKMHVDSIKAIAEGRVWTGEDALKRGLVDRLGGLSEALKLAVDKAKLKNYMVKEYPVKEDFFTKLMKDLDTSVSTRFMKGQLGEDYVLFKKVNEIRSMSGIQARIPFEFEVK